MKSIEIDTSAVDAATESFDRLKVAIEAVNAELTKLGDEKHGGISIQAVGSIVHCEVKPFGAPSRGEIESLVKEGTRLALREYDASRDRLG